MRRLASRAATARTPSAAFRLDALALALRQAVDGVAPAMATCCRRFVSKKGWTLFGFARSSDYARERLGRSGRWLRDSARLGDALERFPALARALDGGDGRRPLGQVAALVIGSVATPRTVLAWIDLARRVPVRQLKQSVRAARAAGSARPLPDDRARVPEPTLEETEAAVELRDIRLIVPRAVRVAFGEALALHRAVCGREAGVASFVEALVAEAFASAVPVEDEVGLAPDGRDKSERESILARVTGRWSTLPDRSSIADPDVLSTLIEARRALEAGCSDDPVALDGLLRDLLGLDERLQRALGRVLMQMGRERAWSDLRFVDLEHYAEQRLGLARTTTRDRARLARGLSRLPCVRRAYDAGDIGFEAALLIRRALAGGPAEPELQRRWVERARRATVKRLRDELRALDRHRLADPGRAYAPLEDREWHASLRQAPGDIRERFWQLAGCTVGRRDGSLLRLRLPAELAADFLGAIDASRKKIASMLGAPDGSVAECGRGVRDPRAFSSYLADDSREPASADAVAAIRSITLDVARTFSTDGRGLPTWVGLLGLLEDFVATWDDPQAVPRRAADRIYVRDGWRCAAPGCTSRRNLENHHVEYRSRGGSKSDPANQVCLCRFHHQRGEHGGLTRCRGEAPLGVVWRLGQRRVGRWYRNECRIDL